MRSLLLCVSSVILLGCSAADIRQSAGRTPALEPERFFDGVLCADGVVRDYTGDQMRQFNALIRASWTDAGVGTLDEVFYFVDEPGDSVVTETRVWTIKRQNGGYMASASDVPEAVPMNFSGNEIAMRYQLEYATGDDTIALTMDDRMFLVTENLLVNETRMIKWGVEVGQVLLTIQKVADESQCRAASVSG